MKSDGGLTDYLVKHSANNGFSFTAITNRLNDAFHIATICSDGDPSRRICFVGDVDEIEYTTFRSWIKLIPIDTYKDCEKRDIVIIDTTELETSSPSRSPLTRLIDTIIVCQRHHEQIIILNIHYRSTASELTKLRADAVLLYDRGMKAMFNTEPIDNFEWV